MLATAKMFVGPAEQMTLIKKDALVLGQSQTMVYVVRTDPSTKKSTAVPVPVATGAAQDDWIQVSGGISTNDSVVVEGNERLRPNQEVMITGTLD
jgi:multidrug efflux pump subunit AcrA (membrane-fusion protein)